MSLNPAVIRNSFENVKPIAAEAVTYFYNYMFQNFPQVRTLFAHTDMEKQKKNLINSLVHIVDNLENTEMLSTYLKKMGARHVDYNVEPPDYEIVGKSLIMTFKHFFGDGWTADLEEQWLLAYGVIADLMIQGASQRASSNHFDSHTKAPNSGDHSIVQTTKDFAKELLAEAVKQQINNPEFKRLAKQEVNEIFKQILQEESREVMNILKKAA